MTESELILPAGGFRGASVEKSASQSIANNVNTVVAWDQEVIDTDGFHDNVTNNSRFTIPAGVSIVEIYLWALWQTNVAGFRQVALRFNNTATWYFENRIAPFDAVVGASHFVGTGPIAVVGADFFDVLAFQNSGVGLNFIGRPFGVTRSISRYMIKVIQ